VERLAALAGRARDEDDPAPAPHHARGGARRVEHRLDVLAHRPRPPRVVQLRDREVLLGPDPGVADEEVDPAELAHHAVDQCLGALARPDVGGVGERPDAAPRDLLHHFRCRVGSRAVADADVRPALGEQHRRRRADPAGTAGDQGPLSP
jgi:hypothetical protein